eukprot:m.99834 g.99834  ORF g.99834 m.99834 type:complete len:116 (+) comp27194_c0_seq1:272-619(+)
MSAPLEHGVEGSIASVIPNTEGQTQHTLDLQEANTLLRSRVLLCIHKLAGQSVDVGLYGGGTSASVLNSIDANLNTIHVSHLETPMGIVSEALLRGTDVTSLTFQIRPQTQESEY